jgi:hypothetical protein
MMKKIYITIPLVFAIASFTGCSKFLGTAPDMRTTLNTPQKVAELLVTAYAQADYNTFTEAASDNAEDKGINVGTLATVNQDAYYWIVVRSKDQGSPTFFWNASYAAISAANIALDAINKQADQTAYLPSKGEALVARAYAHFMLVTLFSKVYDPTGANDSPGIPYATTPETVVFGQYSRETVAATYAHIEQDLLAGLPLIKDVAYTVPKYHFNLAAANAFAARFYLFKRDYLKVISYANAAIPNNAFASFIRPWSSKYYNMTANDFRIAFTQAAETSNLLLTEAPSLWARSNYSYRFGMGLNLNVAQIANNVTGTSFTGEKVYTQGGVPNYSMLKWNELFIRTSANANIGDPYTILPQFTADELLLNRAEAYANLGQYTDAINDMNTFASTRINSYNATTNGVTATKVANYAAAAGVTDTKLQYIYCILDFKKKEFIQEGLRWFDIIRTDITVKHNIKAIDNSSITVTLPPGDTRRVFQLPEEVTLSGIPQNQR